MKLLFILLLAALPQPPLDSYTKPYTDATGKYLVKYTFDARYSRIPGSDSRAPHFNAEVRVFRIVKRDTVAVGQPMQGIYVDGGCTDDKPAEWVRRAKDTHK